MMTERGETPPGGKQADHADDDVDDVVSLVASPSLPGETSEKRRPRDQREHPGVSRHLGQVVVRKEARLPKGAVAAKEIR